MQTAIVLGTFDGLHKGHRAVIEKARGYYTVAVTFNIPPKAFSGTKSKLLIMPEDKAKGLSQLGVSEIYSLDFAKVANVSPEDFFSGITEKFSPSLIACGFNYRFGRGAAGDTATLAALCKEKGIRLCVADSVGGDKPISSSMLRTLIESGDIAAANTQIYGGFGFSSLVLHGNARGKAFGFPTVNQAFPDCLAVPKFGVYQSKIIIDEKEYESITDLGVRPTYKTDFIGCETYVKGLNNDIYGKKVTLKLIRFIRPEKKFEGKEELESAVKTDIKSVLGVEIDLEGA
ncbi:MAG: hypothetical protein J5662_01790 [Clostridia bacterium]|nr:hypothetical protein [Clostridia bacterium]